MRLGRYRLLTQIGAGSDGVSYRAQSEETPGFLEVHELGLARQNPERWAWLVTRLRIAATYTQSRGDPCSWNWHWNMIRLTWSGRGQEKAPWPT